MLFLWKLLCSCCTLAGGYFEGIPQDIANRAVLHTHTRTLSAFVFIGNFGSVTHRYQQSCDIRSFSNGAAALKAEFIFLKDK